MSLQVFTITMSLYAVGNKIQGRQKNLHYSFIQISYIEREETQMQGRRQYRNLGSHAPPPFSCFSVFTVLTPPTFQCIDPPPHPTLKFVALPPHPTNHTLWG